MNYKKYIYLSWALIVLILSACRHEAEPKPTVSFYETDLFKEVQLEGVFEDSKTFVDLVPKKPIPEILDLYEVQKEEDGFSIEDFVADNFSDQSTAILEFETDTTRNMYEHISSIWPKLTRGPDSVIPYSSRIPLPYDYVVPGGRFKEIYYWDSYFTLEGLLVDDQDKLAKNMVNNFTSLIDSLGFIPNGTRKYYLTRSQPPFYSLMVDAVSRKDSSLLLEYLPALKREYNFWMSGQEEITEQLPVRNHLLRINDSIILNRYFDKGLSPRPESYKEDLHLAADLPTDAEKADLYVNMRSGAASGWDFSSRWYEEDGNFASTTTSEIAPVDLNCLLYFLEELIARGYGMSEDSTNEDKFRKLASSRALRIQQFLWDAEKGYFMDYNYELAELTDELTLAGVYPLFFKIATEEQAGKVKERIMNDFLKEGGLLTTLKNSGQQWDAPNGWAPLQWMAVNGLLNYGYKEEAREIMTRWLNINEKVYKNTGKMMEKYNVEDISLVSGGGEYETQDGFGWTNGVALGFRKMLEEMED